MNPHEAELRSALDRLSTARRQLDALYFGDEPRTMRDIQRWQREHHEAWDHYRVVESKWLQAAFPDDAAT